MEGIRLRARNFGLKRKLRVFFVAHFLGIFVFAHPVCVPKQTHEVFCYFVNCLSLCGEYICTLVWRDRCVNRFSILTFILREGHVVCVLRTDRVVCT